MLRRASVMGLALALAIAVLARASSASTPRLSIQIAQSGSFAGPVTYTLTCAPAGGSVPRPSRACAEISSHPSMLEPAPQGSLEPCAFDADVVFAVSGANAGRGVSARFQTCASGQAAVAALWNGVLPSQGALLATHPDHGFGLFSLGETEATVRAALGPGRPAGGPCGTCTRVYPAGLVVALVGRHAFTVSLTVAYQHGTVVSITSNNPRATAGGDLIDAGYGALRRRLGGWKAVACPGGVRLLTHGAGPSTQLVFRPYYTLVTVQDAAPGC